MVTCAAKAGSPGLDPIIAGLQTSARLKLENLHARIRGPGFVPFSLHLSDGRSCAVPHPDFLSPGRSVIVVITPDDVSHTMDPLHIVEVSEAVESRRG